jgi:P4 family phage/plasmid primase-like protien
MEGTKNLKNFLYSRQLKQCTDIDKCITHTRIPSKDKSKGIYGGSYYIKPSEKKLFYKLYYEEVWTKGNHEYLTEKQLDASLPGPLLVDFDFRYPYTITKRVHTHKHIVDMINIYLSEINNLFEIVDNSEIPIYIFEKPTVNMTTTATENITKDGIHMIIGIAMNHTTQSILRKNVMGKLDDAWKDLPFSTTTMMDDILDEGITVGSGPWQLFGSRKPGYDAYRMTYMYGGVYLNGNFTIMEKNVSDFNFKEDLHLISAQNSDHKTFPNTAHLDEQLLNSTLSKIKTNKNNNTTTSSITYNNMYDITTQEQLDTMISNMLSELTSTEHNIKEAHDYNMILPPKYFESGSYNKWIRVAWALKNTSMSSSNGNDNRLFLSFLKLSSKSSTFSYTSVPDIWDIWLNKSYNNPDDGLTIRSIMYWAKTDADPVEYNRVRSDTIDVFLEAMLESETEFDIATLLYQLNKDIYICTSIKSNQWYEFKKHRWCQSDCGTGLRMSISKDLYQLITRKMVACTNLLSKSQPDDDVFEALKKKTLKMTTLALRLKKTVDKNHIMREASEIFYDPNFLTLQDSKLLLLGFNNGIYDFKEQRFRDGRPEDYIVKSTLINYEPLENISETVIAEIHDFMSKLFPVEELRNYMWEHLASTLLGTTTNQTFNIYNGGGSNGKSILVDLMSLVLGQYKGTVPITLITQKRTGIGGTSSEVIALKGLRLAVMQEPSKGDVINEGIMKEITGGDPIQGRELYHSIVTFTPQLKLVVCTNILPEFKSNDDGTWRRIRVVEFISTFVDALNNNHVDKNKPQFLKDKQLNQKFHSWKVGMMALLVDKVNKTKGNVIDCNMVTSKSNQYREAFDYLSEFVKERIIKDQTGSIKKQALYNDFKIWYTNEHGRYVPKGKELYEYMEKKYGKYKPIGWKGISIIPDEDEDVECE